MMKIFTTLILLFVSTSLFARDEHPIDTALGECISDNSTTAGMLNCSLIARSAWDSLLNKNYQELMDNLNGTQQDKLRKSQREWIKFRDEEFEFIDYFYGNKMGSMWPVLHNADKLNFVKNRALKLSYYLNNAGVDVFE